MAEKSLVECVEDVRKAWRELVREIFIALHIEDLARMLARFLDFVWKKKWRLFIGLCDLAAYTLVLGFAIIFYLAVF